ncbi:MAG: uracil phosphoribosyltransferase [Thermomicrobiales bacterium]|jgi:uracil phosphoribosyltransferase|nr:uracil phosphoribosyltransferase [Thermomicrobiales bacterium]
MSGVISGRIIQTVPRPSGRQWVASETETPGEAGRFPNLRVSRHPLVRHNVRFLSDEGTDTPHFRDLVRELTHLLLYEATSDLPLRAVRYRTPLEEAQGSEIDATVGLVPILRAGLGMTDGARDLLPNATVYHVGIYRDETTHHPISYYNRLPARLPTDLMILLDPMLATGGSATAATTELKARGARWIKYVGLIAAPEGVERMLREHPDVDIHVAALDRQLDENKFIRPGLGDAGDRLYGTTGH